MFIRVSIMKFPDLTKSKLYLAIWEKEVIPALEKDPNCHSVDLINIGEAKVMGIAKYRSEEQFQETNKWLLPMVSEYVKSLSGTVESLPGEVMLSWRRTIKN